VSLMRIVRRRRIRHIVLIIAILTCWQPIAMAQAMESPLRPIPAGLHYPPPPETPALVWYSYTAEAGDTLATVGRQFGLTADCIRQANRLGTDTLEAGQVLDIPGYEVWTCWAAEGERLRQVASRYGVRADWLVECNALDYGHAFREGDRVAVPYLGNHAHMVRGQYYRPGKGAQPDVWIGKIIWPVWGRISQGHHADHRAIDIAAPKGRAVVAPRSGVVTTMRWDERGFLGLYIIIEHEHAHVTLETLYAHVNDPRVVVGSVVKEGDVIAYVSDTGRATGDHLHFEVRVDGQRLDPMLFLVGEVGR